MKKYILAMVTVMCLVTMTGCAGGPLTENDDPVAILSEAEAAMGKEKHRGSEIEKIYYYDDDSEEVEKVTVIYDGEKGIRQETTEYEGGFSYTTYNVKEGDSYYVYVQESEDEEQWIRYEEGSASSDTSYEYYAKGVDFSYSEEEGYSNVKYTNVGKDTVAGKETIKIEITADIETGISDDDSMMTREMILEENGWTEEEVALVDGFSVIIDEYVAANNAMGKVSVKYKENVWVDVNTHKVVKTEAITTMDSENSEELNKAVQVFENEYWQMEMLHNDLASGISAEDAVGYLEEAVQALEESGEDEYYEEYYPNQIEESVVEVFMGEDEIPEVNTPPEKYEEMTEEDYYSSMY